MKQNGYYTGFFGKLGVTCRDDAGLFNESDIYDRNGDYADRRGYFYKTIGKDTVHLTRFTGYQAQKFIKNAPTDRPFCLSLSFSAPHAHDNAPEELYDLEKDPMETENLVNDPELRQILEELRKECNSQRDKYLKAKTETNVPVSSTA